MNIKRAVICWINLIATVFICSNAILGQIPAETKVAKSDTDQANVWKEYDIGLLTFRAPDGLVTKERDCIDVKCFDFESELISLSISAGVDVAWPTFEKELPSYTEQFSKIDGARVWIWSYRYDGEFKSQFGARFTFEKGGDYAIGFFIGSRKCDISGISEKIIRSVDFRGKPYKDSSRNRNRRLDANVSVLMKR